MPIAFTRLPKGSMAQKSLGAPILEGNLRAEWVSLSLRLYLHY